MELQALGAFWQILVLLPSLDKSRRWNCRQRRNRKHGFVTRFVAFIQNRRPRRIFSHGVLAASVVIGSIAWDGKHSATALTGESDKARGGYELQNCSFESRFSTRSSTVHRLKSVSQSSWSVLAASSQPDASARDLCPSLTLRVVREPSVYLLSRGGQTELWKTLTIT